MACSESQWSGFLLATRITSVSSSVRQQQKWAYSGSSATDQNIDSLQQLSRSNYNPDCVRLYLGTTAGNDIAAVNFRLTHNTSFGYTIHQASTTTYTYSIVNSVQKHSNGYSKLSIDNSAFDRLLTCGPTNLRAVTNANFALGLQFFDDQDNVLPIHFSNTELKDDRSNSIGCSDSDLLFTMHFLDRTNASQIANVSTGLELYIQKTPPDSSDKVPVIPKPPVDPSPETNEIESQINDLSGDFQSHLRDYRDLAKTVREIKDQLSGLGQGTRRSYKRLRLNHY